MVKGETSNGRRIFTDMDCNLRTSDEFRNWVDREFRTRDTPLIQISNLDFVNIFVLDYLHLISLGVMRTMLLIWFNGELPHKLSSQLRNRISMSLLDMRMHILKEFSRNIRELKLFIISSFLLFVEPVALKNILNNDKCVNF